LIVFTYAEGYLKFGAKGRYEFRSGASDYDAWMYDFGELIYKVDNQRAF